MMLRHQFRISQTHGIFKEAKRWVVNESKTWQKKYKRTTRLELEEYWKQAFKEKWDNRTISSIDDSERGKFYCLSMFPYPSGKLHMGHVRVYTISDTFAHFYRMNGYKVVHPMGWDSFGLPAENAARDRHLDPQEWTKSNISYMKKQLEDLNFTFDWEREISTCDPEYYKWTQYLFIKLFQARLAYRKPAFVNWDPVDKTVLADEQVDEDGRSWRSGAIVEKKYLKQWFFKTTEYSKSLMDSLHEIDENVGIKAMQKNWIGEIDGCYLKLPLVINDLESTFTLFVFCTHPETIFGASHVVIQSCHKNELNQLSPTIHFKKMLSKTDVGVLDNCFIRNPLTSQLLPVILSTNYEEKYEKVISILGVPETDEQARKDAEENNFSYNRVIGDDGTLVNSKKFNYMTRDLARVKILDHAKKRLISNGVMCSSKLQDWLISRQRYWGTPIPIVYCPVHGMTALNVRDLPLKLPSIDSANLYSNKSTFVTESWINTHCPKCGLASKRETDTMDTFVDSAWYYLRYIDHENPRLPFSRLMAEKAMPVDLYIGGKEHATLHLYFARFFSHFLADIGMNPYREPFKKILAQGVIKGKTYQIETTGKYIEQSEVDDTGDTPVHKETGEKVKVSFQKMSKSKLNGVDPAEFVNEWGISITRLFLLYAASPLEDISWDVKTDVIPGVMRWQLKVWTLVTRLLDARNQIPRSKVNPEKLSASLLQDVESLSHHSNKIIKEITNHFTEDCVLSAAVTCLMTLTKQLVRVPDEIVQYSPEFEKAVCALVLMSAPMVPHFASEVWSGLQLMPYKLTDQDWHEDVLKQKWPQPTFPTNFDLVEYRISVNRNVCHAVRLPTDFDQDSKEIRNSIMGHKKVKKRMKGAVAEQFIVDEQNCLIKISTT